MATTYNVLVYGTLKQGYYNAGVLQGAKYLGEYTTLPEYRMYTCGPFPIVFGDGRYSVRGELYAVSDDILRRLDQLESNGVMFERELVPVDGREDRVWMYHGHPGFWEHDRLDFVPPNKDGWYVW